MRKQEQVLVPGFFVFLAKWAEIHLARSKSGF